MSEKIPYFESGDYVAYNNEKGGVIEQLKGDGIVDLDIELYSVPEWISLRAMISTWLADALLYELWVGSDGSSAEKIYCSDLPWPIGKMLFFKQIFNVKKQLGITKDNAEQKEEEVPLFSLSFSIPLSIFWCFSIMTFSALLVAPKRNFLNFVLYALFEILYFKLYRYLLMNRSTGKQILHMELCQLGLVNRSFSLKEGAS